MHHSCTDRFAKANATLKDMMAKRIEAHKQAAQAAQNAKDATVKASVIAVPTVLGWEHVIPTEVQAKSQQEQVDEFLTSFRNGLNKQSARAAESKRGAEDARRAENLAKTKYEAEIQARKKSDLRKQSEALRQLEEEIKEESDRLADLERYARIKLQLEERDIAMRVECERKAEVKRLEEQLIQDAIKKARLIKLAEVQKEVAARKLARQDWDLAMMMVSPACLEDDLGILLTEVNIMRVQKYVTKLPRARREWLNLLGESVNASHGMSRDAYLKKVMLKVHPDKHNCLNNDGWNRMTVMVRTIIATGAW